MNIEPLLSDTKTFNDGYEWIPNSYDGFIQELKHIETTCKSIDSVPLFRGHSDRKWLLDSTFVRSFKATLFGIRPEERLTNRILESAEFHPAILNLFLLKFGVLTRPSNELEEVAIEHPGIDSWFEFMKRIQQYPEEDGFFLKGTHLLDWSLSAKVALYFANYKRDGEGAVFICDSQATGKTLQRTPLGAILDKMNEVGKSGRPLGAPLLFSPNKQIKNQRPKNQQAVYFAQMDLRYDLAEMWQMYEKEYNKETILIKLVLPADTEELVQEHLREQGIDDGFIYPDSESV